MKEDHENLLKRFISHISPDCGMSYIPKKHEGTFADTIEEYIKRNKIKKTIANIIRRVAYEDQ